MNVRHVCQWCAVSVLLALGFSFAANKAISAPPAPAAQPAQQAEAEQGVEVLTRGPVHEAFAETVTFDPEPGVVVPKEAPAAIEEVPPDQQPEGANVAWIPGYWGWDDERNDFLWISGIWRDLPPGRQWVPGYWGQSDQGYQWTSGYWADASVSDVEYLPEPPASVEVGPSAPATSPDDTWLPGCWVWQNTRYAWRPGFWAAVQPNWVWTPAHYVWAPRGYVFVDGYWDYSIGRRGVLFAPVYLGGDVYRRPGFSYSPTMVIDVGAFSAQLFLRPRYQHYYFGNYYAANYGRAGFYPSYAVNSGRFGYDPIYAHNRWQNRHDRGWEQSVRAEYLNRRNNPAGRNTVAAVPLKDFRGSKNTPLRFQPVNQADRQRLAQQAQNVQRFGQQRQKLETTAAGGPVGAASKTFAPGKVRLPASPIVAKSGAPRGKNQLPPKVYQPPKVDTNVASKPRGNRSLEQPKERAVNRKPLDQPKAQPKPPPKVERKVPQPQNPPKAKQPDPRPQNPPKAKQSAPQQQPKVNRQAPQQQPKATRQAPPSRNKEPARGPSKGSKQDQPKDKDRK